MSKALEIVKAMLAPLPRNGVVVLDYYDAPEELRAFSSHGGDEDFILIHEGDIVVWSYRLVICGEDTHEIGDGYYITITSHA
jgi:hypothetical protein